MRWHGHITRSTGLAKMIPHGTVQVGGGGTKGRQKKEMGRQQFGLDRFKVGRSP